jgi:hypothetical protein
MNDGLYVIVDPDFYPDWVNQEEEDAKKSFLVL